MTLLISASVLLSIFSFIFLWKKGPKEARVPASVFLGAYSLTTVIGATAIGITHGEVLEALEFSVHPSGLDRVGDFRYWILLYLPLVLVPLVVVFLESIMPANRKGTDQQSPARTNLNEIQLLAVFFSFSAYCVFVLFQRSALGNILRWAEFQGDYTSMIDQRFTIMISANMFFFGLIYTGLPVLSYSAMYQSLTTRRNSWRAVSLITMASVALFSLETMQKSILLVYLIFAAMGYAHMRKPSWLFVLGGTLLLITVFVVLNSFYQSVLDLEGSIYLLFFRMASCFPFYVCLYPESLPHTGVDFGLDVLGIAKTPTENLAVYNEMYPTTRWIQGSAPAPAHIVAYAQAGYVYVFVMIPLIALSIWLIGRLRRQVKGPLSFAFYVQCLVFLYYLTQTSIREALISSYGLLWGGLVLVTLAMTIRASRRVSAGISSARPTPDSDEANQATSNAAS